MVSLGLLLFICCKQKQTTTAKIIERKTINNEVLIKYTFSQNNQQFVDSEVVANIVIPHDSLVLEIEGNTHKLLIP